MKKIEYIVIENEKVVKHEIGDSLPKGAKKVSNFLGYVGIDIKYLDNKYNLISLEELVEKGIVKDNRGEYYNTTTKDKIVVSEIGIDIPENTTKLIPKINDDWDGEKWVINFKKEKENKIEYLDLLIAQGITSGYDYNGVKISTSLSAQSNWNNLINRINAGMTIAFPYPISCVDGSNIMIETKEELLSLYKSASESLETKHNQALMLRKSILDCTKIEQLNEISLS